MNTITAQQDTPEVAPQAIKHQFDYINPTDYLIASGQAAARHNIPAMAEELVCICYQRDENIEQPIVLIENKKNHVSIKLSFRNPHRLTHLLSVSKFINTLHEIGIALHAIPHSTALTVYDEVCFQLYNKNHVDQALKKLIEHHLIPNCRSLKILRLHYKQHQPKATLENNVKKSFFTTRGKNHFEVESAQ